MYAFIQLEFSEPIDVKKLISAAFGGDDFSVSEKEKEKIVVGSQYYKFKNDVDFLNTVSYVKENASFVFMVLGNKERSIEVNVQNSRGKSGIKNLKASAHKLARQLSSGASSLNVKVDYQIEIFSAEGQISVGKKQNQFKKIWMQLLKGAGQTVVVAASVFFFGEKFGVSKDKIDYALIVAATGFIYAIAIEWLTADREGYVYEDN